MLTRVVIFELMQALKAKTILLESNMLTLISFVLQVSNSQNVNPAMKKYLNNCINF